ncbi:MAG: cytidylate kinase family protein [Candidatus Woesearchaeota archaeon]
MKQLRIVISGTPGSGKSTLAKALAKRLGLKRFSAGDFARQLAAERGLTILKLNKLAEEDPQIDMEIDKRTIELGKKERSFVMDSRIAWNFIPQSVKIFLKADPNIAAKRIFKDLRPVEQENTSIEKVQKNIKKRTASERARYKKLYSIDFTDESNYDLVIDTSHLSPAQVLKRVMRFLKTKGF